MSSERAIVIDFVARGDSADEWKMVLVEAGPWTPPFESEMRRLQDRLYGAIDAALNGQLAEKFPESRGKRIVIQLDAYNLPRGEVGQFFERFAEGALLAPEYEQALRGNQFVNKISFRCDFDSIN